MVAFAGFVRFSEERLVELVGRVADDGNRERPGDHSGVERERADREPVVARGGRRAVRRRVVDRHRLGARRRQRGGERAWWPCPRCPPSSETSLIVSEGRGSSSRIVPTPWASAIEAFVAPDRLTKNVSSTSSVVSPTTGTEIVFVPCPGSERERAGGRRVVAGLDGGRVGGRVVDGHGQAARDRQRHVEVHVRRPGVALGDRHVVDDDGRRRVVVGDGAGADRGGDRHVRGVRQGHAVGLVRLVAAGRPAPRSGSFASSLPERTSASRTPRCSRRARWR